MKITNFFIKFTGEATSKVAVVVSISTPFCRINVGLHTVYGRRAYVKKPKLPTYTHDNPDSRI